MPVDPQLAAFLEASNRPGVPKMWEVGPEGARAMARAMIAVTNSPRQPVADVRDRTIPGPGGPIPVRIYTPSDAAPRGALVYFHGSGFVIYDLDSHDSECRAMCNRAGITVVSVDYRLAPEHKFPAAVEDSFAALEWTAANAAELGVDPARIAVGGDSAGGNLAAVVAQIARDRGGPRIAFQLLVYPVTDARLAHPSMDENAEGYGLSRAQMAWFIEQYVRGEADKLDSRCSPLLAKSLADLPPALVITAEYDVLRDEGEAYARRLIGAGVRTALTRYTGMIHGAFQMHGLVDSGRAMLEQAGDALRAAIGLR
jgi:acetyl esterase